MEEHVGPTPFVKCSASPDKKPAGIDELDNTKEWGEAPKILALLPKNLSRAWIPRESNQFRTGT
jgi:hypothetical protein